MTSGFMSYFGFDNLVVGNRVARRRMKDRAMSNLRSLHATVSSRGCLAVLCLAFSSIPKFRQDGSRTVYECQWMLTDA